MPTKSLSPSGILPAHLMRRRVGVFQRADAVKRLVIVHGLLHAGAILPQLLRLLLAHLALRHAGVYPRTVGGRQFRGKSGGRK